MSAPTSATYNSPLMPQIGCTDFTYTQRNIPFCGRTMDSIITTDSTLTIYNRETPLVLTSVRAPGSLQSRSVTAYGFVAINAPGITEVIEGMNEHGLSFGFLPMPLSRYPKINPDCEKMCVKLNDLGTWILGNYKNIQELRLALPSFQICDEENSNLVPFHIALHDNSGTNLVIEFIDGEVKCFDNPLGVLTNEPVLPDQLAAVKENCIIPSSSPTSAKILETRVLLPVESTLETLPSDWSSSSRFQRAAILVNHFSQCEGSVFENSKSILDELEIPRGALSISHENRKVGIRTQWSTLKNLKEIIFYFRSASNSTFQKLDLKNIKFFKDTSHRPIVIHPVSQPVQDVTASVSFPSPKILGDIG